MFFSILIARLLPCTKDHHCILILKLIFIKNSNWLLPLRIYVKFYLIQLLFFNFVFVYFHLIHYSIPFNTVFLCMLQLQLKSLKLERTYINVKIAPFTALLIWMLRRFVKTKQFPKCRILTTLVNSLYYSGSMFMFL